MAVQPITDAEAQGFDLTLWSAPARAVGAALWLASRVGGPVAFAWVFLVFDPPAGPALPVLAFVAALLGLVAAERMLVHAQRGRGRVQDGALRVDAAGRSLALPLAAVAELRPWRVPLPLPGITWIAADPGAAPVARLGLEDPGPLLCALAGAGVAPPAPGAALAHAGARAQWRRGRRVRSAWLRAAFRYGAWSLIPTCAFVYTHQSIAFGGVFGEWNLYGARSWAITFARFWLACAVLTLVYGGACRALFSLGGWLATHVAPSQAARARRVAERGDALVYYAGVPALTALRYLP